MRRYSCHSKVLEYAVWASGGQQLQLDPVEYQSLGGCPYVVGIAMLVLKTADAAKSRFLDPSADLVSLACNPGRSVWRRLYRKQRGMRGRDFCGQTLYRLEHPTYEINSLAARGGLERYVVTQRDFC